MVKKRKVRLRDIAERAGVSIATISLVLNNKALAGNVRISDETAFHVRCLAREMGYFSQGVVGLVAPQFGDYFLGMINGAMSVLMAEKHMLAMGMATGWDVQHEIAGLQLMDNKGFDGLIMGASPACVEQLEKAPSLFHNRKRVVLMNWLSHSGISYVTIDHERCGYLATKHLLERGHCRIAFAGMHYPSEDFATQIPIIDSRFHGYVRAMKEYGLPWISAESVEAVFDLSEPVTGVYCGRSKGALDLLGICWDRGVRVPDDLSIVGQDDGWEKNAVRPRITTIDVHEREVGIRAARMILDLISDKNPQDTILQPELIERDSIRVLNTA